MSLFVATHDGTFHADDVAAYSLLRAYVDPDATILRTRDAAKLATADIVIDVGGVFDPSAGRFDHHQKSYAGPRSSAGMILDWLEAEGRVRPALASRLRSSLVDYIDDVDNGREKPVRGRPCVSAMVGMIGESATDHASFDPLFVRASNMILDVVRGIDADLRKEEGARVVVAAAMDEAAKAGRNVVLLDGHTPWKKAYFHHGGESHETEFVLFPGERDVRVMAIPPELDSFAQKRSFPAEWAGLENEALSAVVGVEGCRFCHKNRFIAVFTTREAAEAALRSVGLWDRATLG